MSTKTDYELTPGQMVGEYRIDRKIGEGGFGKVYAATHPLIGKAAAVKVLNPALASHPEMVARFMAEARAVNQIRHRNIIDIFAFGTLPGGLNYFVMEFLEGLTLDAYVKKNKPLAPAQALSILWPIGRALGAAHKAGILHRDLKPENVFLTFDQDGAIFPKLLDFGIAKLLNDGEMAARTRTGEMLGTPVYMSPEQCKGGTIDHRSDIYSFGIMLHEVLTGQRPFTADSLIELLLKQVNEAAPPMSRSRPDLPRALDMAVLHMLEKEPSRRPESMQAALDEIAAAATSAGIAVPASAQSPGASPPSYMPPATGPAQGAAPPMAHVPTQPRPPVAPQPTWPQQPYPTPHPYATPHGHSGAAWGNTGPAAPMAAPPMAAPPGYGYPAGSHAPTLQSAQSPVPPKSSLGIIIAVVVGLLLLMLVGIVILIAASGSSQDSGWNHQGSIAAPGPARCI